MASVQFIEYRSSTICYTDLSGARADEVVAICRQSQRLMHGLPENSVYSLINVAGMQFDEQSLAAIQETLKANRPFVRASALFGLEGLPKLLIHTVIVFSGRDVKVFNDLRIAKEWLRGKASPLRAQSPCPSTRTDCQKCIGCKAKRTLALNPAV